MMEDLGEMRDPFDMEGLPRLMPCDVEPGRAERIHLRSIEDFARSHRPPASERLAVLERAWRRALGPALAASSCAVYLLWAMWAAFRLCS